MRKSTTDRMNDYDAYDAVVMGVLEPILVLSNRLTPTGNERPPSAISGHLQSKAPGL